MNGSRAKHLRKFIQVTEHLHPNIPARQQYQLLKRVYKLKKRFPDINLGG